MRFFRRIGNVWWAALLAFALAACAATSPIEASRADTVAAPEPVDPIALLNRVTWGANDAAARELAALGTQRYLERQLHPAASPVLPPAVQAQIDAMSISQRPMEDIGREIEARRKALRTAGDVEQRKAMQKEYQQDLQRLGREAASRMLLRALYSPDQLNEQMTWFWMNHFNVFQFKGPIRALIADYEEHAIRPHALGRFRDLLGATARHPAMLFYLDNARNAYGRLNENYARELMELHTLGVQGGYSQQDVQELARILTGFGINVSGNTPRLKPGLEAQYVRAGLFEFNPNRHDYGDKTFLGKRVEGRGAAELDEALDRLARHPATARFVSRKLALYFVSDDPSPALVERLAATYARTDGNIAEILRTLFVSPEFARSLGHKFRDPLHYAIAAVRLAYEERPILNPLPMLGWLARMGQPLYGRQTPEGYPLTADAWASPGQMTARFDVARAIGGASAGLFKTAGPQPTDEPAFPQLANALYYRSLQKALSGPTRQALEQARSPQEWNLYLLSSPEFMYR